MGHLTNWTASQMLFLDESVVNERSLERRRARLLEEAHFTKRFYLNSLSVEGSYYVMAAVDLSAMT
jgi:hypothetical protein